MAKKTPIEIIMIKAVMSRASEENKKLFFDTTTKFLDTYSDLVESGSVEKAGIFHMAMTMANHQISTFIVEFMEKEGLLDEAMKKESLNDLIQMLKNKS